MGLFFDSNLSFHEHYDFLISRGRKMLGCLKRWTVDFKNTRAIIILYNSLVRSILEYNCIIWSPFYGTHISRIESVQNNFLKYLKYKLKISILMICTLSPLTCLCPHLKPERIVTSCVFYIK
jgi:hypothetical protein